VIRTRAAPNGGQPDALDGLTLVTWNIHLDGGDLPALVRALRAGSLTGGRPAGHFVLLLEEVGRGGNLVPLMTAGMPAPPRVDVRPPDPGRDIVQVARTLDLSLFYVASMRNGREEVATEREDRGNAILSTLPLADFTAIELPFGRHRRVAITARVEGAGGLRVAAVHLDASVGGRRLWVFSSGVRGRQAKHLVKTFAPEELLVVGADLNTWSEALGEPAYQEFARAFPQTARPRIAPTFRIPWLVDYMFFRLPDGWTGTSHRAEDRYGSDHHPIAGVITRS
jgi:endonuclease/exonuclease/phosphatase family metal-dependent hydrolase